MLSFWSPGKQDRIPDHSDEVSKDNVDHIIIFEEDEEKERSLLSDRKNIGLRNVGFFEFQRLSE